MFAPLSLRSWFMIRHGAVAAVLLATLSCAPRICAAPEPPKKFTKAQESAWHLEQGKKFWEDNKTDEAVAQWKEALRIDPTNQEAKDLLAQAGAGDPAPSAPQEDPVKRSAEMVAGAKDVLTRYARARDLVSLSETLEDRTADDLARPSLVALRDAIQTYEGGANAWDATLYDDFEHFIDNSGLSGIAEVGASAGYSTARLHGRAFLNALLPWVDRAGKCHVNLLFDYPDGQAHAADHLDKDTFTETEGKALLLDGPGLDEGVPLEAREEDGEWRVGARKGQSINFNVRVDVSKRLVRRG
jgi:hypothetical protein